MEPLASSPTRTILPVIDQEGIALGGATGPGSRPSYLVSVTLPIEAPTPAAAPTPWRSSSLSPPKDRRVVGSVR